MINIGTRLSRFTGIRVKAITSGKPKPEPKPEPKPKSNNYLKHCITVSGSIRRRSWIGTQAHRDWFENQPIGYIIPPFGNEPHLYIDRNPDSDERARNRGWTLVKEGDVCAEKRTITTKDGTFAILEERRPGGGYHLERL